MAGKNTKKKVDTINESAVKKPMKKVNEDMNWMVNIGESPLRTYEMLRNRFLNI